MKRAKKIRVRPVPASLGLLAELAVTRASLVRIAGLIRELQGVAGTAATSSGSAIDALDSVFAQLKGLTK